MTQTTIARGATVPKMKESAFCVMIINLNDPLSHTSARPFCESAHSPACIHESRLLKPSSTRSRRWRLPKHHEIEIDRTPSDAPEIRPAKLL
jgi:hypothetical protein